MTLSLQEISWGLISSWGELLAFSCTPGQLTSASQASLRNGGGDCYCEM